MGREEFRRAILLLDPLEFEYFVAHLWEHLRDGTATVTEASGDMGVDVEVSAGRSREVIQVKRYRPDDPVGRPDVQQYYALYDQTNADRVTIVTASRFTDEAKTYAGKQGVTLFDGDDLFDLIKDAGLADEVAEWFGGGTYEFVDDGSGRFGLLDPLFGLLGVVRALRPVWTAVLTVAFVGVTVVARTLAVPPVGSSPLAGPLEDVVATTPEWLASIPVGLFLAALVGYPMSLLLDGDGSRLKWFGGLVVAFAVVSATFPPGNPVGGWLLVVILALTGAITAYDFWTVHREEGVIPRIRAGLAAPFSGDPNGGADTVRDVDLSQYATVVATKGPSSRRDERY